MLQCEQMAMIVLLTGYTAVACAQTSVVVATVSSLPVLVACVEPRPQLCTMQYDPVCGLTANNQYKTYSNACSACSDTNSTVTSVKTSPPSLRKRRFVPSIVRYRSSSQ